MLACSDSPQGTAVTLIRWAAGDALTADRDLTLTTLAGNLVVATQGLTQPAESFYIPQPPAQRIDMPPAIVRTGPNDTPADPSLQYLYTLRFAPMAWLQPSDPTQPPQPEIVLTGQAPGAAPVSWEFLEWLLDAEPFDPAFTVDAARYSRIAGTVGDTLRYDYDGDAGDTLRFGDGVFGADARAGGDVHRDSTGPAGARPATSPPTRSRRSIRPIPGRRGCSASPTRCRPPAGPTPSRWRPSVAWHRRRSGPCSTGPSCRRTTRPPPRPCPGSSGPAPSSDGPGAGSPSSPPPSPLATEQATVNEREQLIDLLNRYRMAGYESYVPDPEYVSVDLIDPGLRPADGVPGGRRAGHLDGARLGAGRLLRPRQLHVRPAAGEERPGGGRAGVPRRGGRDLRPLPDSRPHGRLHPDGRRGRRGLGPDHPLRQRPEPAGERVAPDRSSRGANELLRQRRRSRSARAASSCSRSRSPTPRGWPRSPTASATTRASARRCCSPAPARPS